jgi:hypothetical protein
MSLSRSKCWYSNNCLHLFKCAVIQLVIFQGPITSCHQLAKAWVKSQMSYHKKIFIFEINWTEKNVKKQVATLSDNLLPKQSPTLMLKITISFETKRIYWQLEKLGIAHLWRRNFQHNVTHNNDTFNSFISKLVPPFTLLCWVS